MYHLGLKSEANAEVSSRMKFHCIEEIKLLSHLPWYISKFDNFIISF